LAWKIELSREAEKSLSKLGADAAKRIAKGLREVAALDSPRQRGEAMVGNHAGHWRYRFGDYRVIARLEDGRMVVLVIAVGHRREVYR
jgi:mRNA interferase RelE/StbE